jgi:hypothetical protein
VLYRSGVVSDLYTLRKRPRFNFSSVSVNASPWAYCAETIRCDDLIFDWLRYTVEPWLATSTNPVEYCMISKSEHCNPLHVVGGRSLTNERVVKVLKGYDLLNPTGRAQRGPTNLAARASLTAADPRPRRTSPPSTSLTSLEYLRVHFPRFRHSPTERSGMSIKDGVRFAPYRLPKSGRPFGQGNLSKHHANQIRSCYCNPGRIYASVLHTVRFDQPSARLEGFDYVQARQWPIKHF